MTNNANNPILSALKPYDYRLRRLANGLRVVCSQCRSRVNYIGVAVNAGSRDEPEVHQGLAHFVEHTIFKGTRNLKSWQISNRMERVGGELNAYTSKETTVFYTIAPAGDPERAVALLSDLLANSIFPAAEIDKEKEVVIEEIRGALDTPSELVFDQFETMAYRGSGLGHDILGTPESVAALTGPDCRGFVERLYTPGEMVLFCQGPDDPEKVMRLADKHFGWLHLPDRQRDRQTPPPPPPFREVNDRNGHQAHTLLGAPVFSRHDPRRFALFLFNNHLGGPSMNSRLNQELREKRGLVYAVDSNVSLLSDTGMQYVYFGTDRDSVEKCHRLIRRELEKLAEKELSPRTFEAIKRQYCGQLLVNSDNREATAMSMGRSVLFFDEVHDAAMTARRVADVTPAQFREMAELVAAGADHMLTVC